MVSAVDINKGRLRILKETAILHQVDDVVNIIHADLRIFSVSYDIEEKSCFSKCVISYFLLFLLQETNIVKCDKVLLDAPCSGLGVLSKVIA